MLESLLLLSALAGTPHCASSSLSAPPPARTPVKRLASPGTSHHRVLVIEQDFHPNEGYEIAIDGWVACTKQLADVRMWWMDTSRGGERSPFGKGVRRFIDIDYRRASTDRWTIELRNGRKDFTFDIELDENGTPRAYGTVELSSGHLLTHCQIENGRLVARKILGIPAGLKSLDVVCLDGERKRHRGSLRPR